MTLVVEDGTGKADAESYVSSADCALYAAARGLTFTADAAGDAALRRATGWIDATYITRWPGTRSHGRAQALQWPRTGAVDVEGYPILDNEIPGEVIDALCEAACRELATPAGLTPDIVPGSIIQSASVDGAVSVTYAAGATAADMLPIVNAVDNILMSLIGRKQTAVLFGKSERA